MVPVVLGIQKNLDSMSYFGRFFSSNINFVTNRNMTILLGVNVFFKLHNMVADKNILAA